MRGHRNPRPALVTRTCCQLRSGAHRCQYALSAPVQDQESGAGEGQVSLRRLLVAAKARVPAAWARKHNGGDAGGGERAASLAALGTVVSLGQFVGGVAGDGVELEVEFVLARTTAGRSCDRVRYGWRFAWVQAPAGGPCASTSDRIFPNASTKRSNRD